MQDEVDWENVAIGVAATEEFLYRHPTPPTFLLRLALSRRVPLSRRGRKMDAPHWGFTKGSGNLVVFPDRRAIPHYGGVAAIHRPSSQLR